MPDDLTADDLRKASAFILAFTADAWRGSLDRQAEFTEIASRLSVESKRKSATQTVANMTAADEKSFWEARSELTAIRDFAHAWIGGPWAFLGSVLARVVAAVPHYVVLPPFAGPPAALNLYIALTGEPNTGKGKANRAAGHILPGTDVHVVNLGSGEGLAHAYQEWRKNRNEEAGHLEWVRRSALFQVQEATLLRALSERSGSTLDGVLRSAWMGESLGFAYADKAKRLDLPELSYRLCLVAQVTPSLGPVLLDGRNEGTPQRFVFLPVTDPAAPPPPAAPPLLLWDPPGRELAADLRAEVDVAGPVREEIIADLREKQRRAPSSPQRPDR